MSISASAEPHEIHHGIVIPLLLESGFQFNTDQSNQHRFKTSFLWSRFHVEKDPASEFYGQTCTLQSNVVVVAVPMGTLLIVHGIVRENAVSHERISLQIRRSQSLDTIRQQVKLDLVAKLIELVSVRIDELPVEFKLNILTKLPVKSIVVMSRVSTEWMHLSEDEQLWKTMVKKHYPALVDVHPSDQTWKSQFQAEYIRRQNARRPLNFIDLPPAFRPIWATSLTPLNAFMDPYDPMTYLSR